jgi:hypothetical protein
MRGGKRNTLVGAAALVASMGLAPCVPASARSVQAGIQAWQQSDYAGAVAIWRPLAEAGDPDAAFNLGQAYRLGRGVKTNLAAAETWLDRAAVKGHVDAQTTLGLLLFDSGDRTAGLRWLKAAAEAGEPRALLVYGTALFNGDSMTRNPVLGYAYVSRAAAQGFAPAKGTLAQMDEVLPLDQRKKGVALAMVKAKAAKSKLKVTGKAKPAVKPVQAGAPRPLAKEPQNTATGGWRVQLGAFSKRSSAEALFKRVSAAGPLAGRQPYFIPAGAVTRLQVGPFPSRAAATAACASLTAKGQGCFPVAAK